MHRKWSVGNSLFYILLSLLQQTIIYSNWMEVDINEPKSKAFNVFLRMFQLALQLILAYWASKHEAVSQCDYTLPNIISYIAYALAGLNLIALIAIRCAKKFPRILFFLFFLADFLIVIAIIVLQMIKGISQCAAAKVFQEFSFIASGNTIVICIVIFVMRLAWGQRYTNAPGNIAWPILFLMYQWSSRFNIFMLIIGIGTALVSVLTLLVHLFTFIRTSTSTIKALKIGWGIGLAILAALQILAIVIYLNGQGLTEFVDVHAKRTLGVFIAVNALDILFWLWGMKTLDYEKGDEVRDNLFTGKDNNYRNTRLVNDQSVLVTHEIGTIN